jgi:hypothetical protein
MPCRRKYVALNIDVISITVSDRIEIMKYKHKIISDTMQCADYCEMRSDLYLEYVLMVVG